jgi:hypothetical protein
MKNIKKIEKELTDKFYLDMKICQLTISTLSGNKVSVKLFDNDKKLLSTLTIVNLHKKSFENFIKNPKTNLSLNITNKNTMESWKFSVIDKDKFLVDIDSEYCAFLTKEDIQKIVDGLTIQKKDILGESRVLTFDEFVLTNLGDFENQTSQELEDELLFDIHDEPINLDRYDSKRDVEFDDCYFDCYNSDKNFESDIDDYFGLDFYDEIEEMALFSDHGLERIKERGITSTKINNILDSCKLKLLKLRDELGKKILIRSTRENVSVVGTLQKINRELKFKVITAIQGIGLVYDDSYNLIKI